MLTKRFVLKIFIQNLIAVSLLFTCFPSIANDSLVQRTNLSIFFPFYFGGIIGYGDNDWDQLIARDPSSSLVTPVKAKDTGLVWGFFLGYQPSKAFAFEASYWRLPNAELKLSEFSMYYPTEQFSSATHAYSLVGKFIVPIARTGLQLYANAGIGFVNRQDILAKRCHVGPTFGVGVMYTIKGRILTDFGFQYFAGFGESDAKPLMDYIPFLYAVTLRLGYRFHL